MKLTHYWEILTSKIYILRCWKRTREDIYDFNLLILFRKKSHLSHPGSFFLPLVILHFLKPVSVFLCKYVVHLGIKVTVFRDYKDLLDHPVWPTRDSP